MNLVTSRVEKLLELLMLAGVAASAACMAMGVALFLSGGDAETATGIVMFGLIVLMATPGLRVAIAVLEAMRSRDWFFVLITAAVVLLLGMTAALALRQR